MGHNHAHSHSPAARNKGRLAIVLGLTATYLVAEGVAGWWTNSLALLADAGHMLADVAGLGLALLAIHFAGRPATPERTYGYYRVEILAALINAVVLLGISGLILYEAYERFRNPPPVASGPMLVVAVIGLGVNIAGMLLLHAGAGESLNIKGAYFEVLSDALGSLGVIVAAVVIWATRWYYADPLISAAIGLFILPRTWGLLSEAVHVLLEGTPAGLDLAAVRAVISGIDGVVDVHDLHAWSLTTGVNALSAHVVLDGSASPGDVLTEVHRRVTADFPIGHATIQVEPEGWAGEEGEYHL
ncbi:MAG: cation transporter [Isosphaeraceae bacterium]|nr:cation transporter [Isosphaeraceae bacterium]